MSKNRKQTNKVLSHIQKHITILNVNKSIPWYISYYYCTKVSLLWYIYKNMVLTWYLTTNHISPWYTVSH